MVMDCVIPIKFIIMKDIEKCDRSFYRQNKELKKS